MPFPAELFPFEEDAQRSARLPFELTHVEYPDFSACAADPAASLDSLLRTTGDGWVTGTVSFPAQPQRQFGCTCCLGVGMLFVQFWTPGSVRPSSLTMSAAVVEPKKKKRLGRSSTQVDIAPALQRQCLIAVPLALVAHWTVKGCGGKTCELALVCSDFLRFACALPAAFAQQVDKALSRLAKHGGGGKKTDARPAFARRALPGGVSAEQQLQRHVLASSDDDDEQWTVSACNADYKLCDSYPAAVVLPAALGGKQLRKLAGAYAASRFPICCWLSPPLDATGRRCAVFRSAVPLRKGSKTRHHGAAANHVFVDAVRAATRCALVNVVSLSTATTTSATSGDEWRIPSRGASKQALLQLAELCLLRFAELAVGDTAVWLQQLRDAAWFGQLRQWLLCALAAANELSTHGASLLLQSENGGRAVAIVAALVQLLVDPRCRTTAGFAYLVKKEFHAAGFNVTESASLSSSSSSSTVKSSLLHGLLRRSRSIYLQFFDIVWQLHVRNACHFEFTDALLLFYAHHSVSGCFPQAVAFDARSAAADGDAAPDLCDYVQAHAQRWRNADYQPADATAFRQHARATLVELQAAPSLWHDYFLKSYPAFSLPPGMRSPFVPGAPSQHTFACTSQLVNVLSVRHSEALHALRFDDNVLSVLPSATLRGPLFQRLTVLSLCRNCLSSLPAELAACQRLRRLHLDHNHFRLLPAVIAELPLKVLTVAHNQLTALPLPSDAGRATLQRLDADYNWLTDVELSNQVKLAGLSLAHNRLYRLPDCLSTLTALAELDVHANAVRTAFDVPPLSAQLRSLDVSDNQLDLLPLQWIGLTALQTLRLDGNNIDRLPAQLLAKYRSDGVAGLPFMAGLQRYVDAPQSAQRDDEVVDWPVRTVLFLGAGPASAVREQALIADLLRTLAPHLSAQEAVRHVAGSFNPSSVYEPLACSSADGQRLLLDVKYVSYADPLSLSLFINAETASSSCSCFFVFVDADAADWPSTLELYVRYLFNYTGSLIDRTPNINLLIHASASTPAQQISGQIDRIRVAQRLQRRVFLPAQPSSQLCWELVSRACERLRGAEPLRCAASLLGCIEVLLRVRRSLPVLLIGEFVAMLDYIGVAEVGRCRELLAASGLISTVEERRGPIDIVATNIQWFYAAAHAFRAIEAPPGGNFDGVLTVQRMHALIDRLEQQAEERGAPFPLSQPLRAGILRLLVDMEFLYPAATFQCASAGSPLQGGLRFFAPFLLALDAPSAEAVERLWPAATTTMQEFHRIYTFQFLPVGLFKLILVRLQFIQQRAASLLWWSGAVFATSDHEVAYLQYSPSTRTLYMRYRTPRTSRALLGLLTGFVDLLISDHYKTTANEVAKEVVCRHCLAQRVEPPHRFAVQEVLAAFVGGTPLQCRHADNPFAVRYVAPDLSLADVPRVRIDLGPVPRVLGRGAFSTVYLGSLASDAFSQCAVKLLACFDEPSQAARSQAAADFIREVTFMQLAGHPNIVRLIGLGETETPSMVVEYLPYGTLHELLRRDAAAGYLVSEQWILYEKIALDVARGLDFLHSLSIPIVHRDLRSPNIFLQSVDRASCWDLQAVHGKIGDFGLSCFGDVPSRELLLSWEWLPPEAIDPASRTYNYKIDVYSFAILLWECLARAHPFSEYEHDYASHMALKQAIIKGLRPRLPPDTPPHVAALLDECWKGQPAERPDAGFIVQYLEQVLTNQEPVGLVRHLSSSRLASSSSSSTVVHQQGVGQPIDQRAVADHIYACVRSHDDRRAVYWLLTVASTGGKPRRELLRVHYTGRSHVRRQRFAFTGDFPEPTCLAQLAGDRFCAALPDGAVAVFHPMRGARRVSVSLPWQQPHRSRQRHVTCFAAADSATLLSGDDGGHVDTWQHEHRDEFEHVGSLRVPSASPDAGGVTALLVLAGGKAVWCASAGHIHPLQRRADGSLHALTALPVGAPDQPVVALAETVRRQIWCLQRPGALSIFTASGMLVETFQSRWPVDRLQSVADGAMVVGAGGFHVQIWNAQSLASVAVYEAAERTMLCFADINGDFLGCFSTQTFYVWPLHPAANADQLNQLVDDADLDHTVDEQ